MKRISQSWLIIIFIISIITLSIAFIAEYFFNLIPCDMCLKQRYPYYLIILFSILFYIFNQKRNILLFTLLELAILYGLFYAIWHVGIEQGIFNGPQSCSGNLLEVTSIENLKDKINNQPIVNCSDISWKIMNLSAALLNSLLLFFLLIFNSIYILNHIYGSKKTN